MQASRADLLRLVQTLRGMNFFAGWQAAEHRNLQRQDHVRASKFKSMLSWLSHRAVRS